MGKGKSKGRSEWTWGPLEIAGGDLVHPSIHSFIHWTNLSGPGPALRDWLLQEGRAEIPPGPGHLPLLPPPPTFCSATWAQPSLTLSLGPILTPGGPDSARSAGCGV